MLHLSWKGQLYTYTGCIFLAAISYTACIPFLPVYLLELGTPKEDIELWTALVFSSAFLIGGVMAPVWGKLSDLYGKKGMALRSAVLLCVTYTAGGIVTSPEQLLLMRVVQGFAVGYLPVVLSIVSDHSPREELGSSLGLIQSAQLVGTVSGPLVGGLLADLVGLRTSFFVAGAELLPVVIITMLMPNDPPKADRKSPQGSVISDLVYCVKEFSVREILILTLIFNMLMLAMQPLLPLFVGELAEDGSKVATYTGLVCSLPPFIGAVIAPLWGRFGQRRGFFRAMTLALTGTGFTVVLQGLSPNFTMLLVYSSLMGLFMVGIVPALNAAVTIVTPDDFKGRAFGAMTLFNQIGCMMGPVMSAAIAKTLSLGHIFIISGVLFIAMSVYTGLRHMQMHKAMTEGSRFKIRHDPDLNTALLQAESRLHVYLTEKGGELKESSRDKDSP